MKRLCGIVLFAPALMAHMMSMSSGDAAVKGNRLHYEFRIPVYEIAHLQDPESALFGQIRFASGGEQGRLVSKTCREDAGGGSFACAADYEFPRAVDRLEVECRFYSVTVPNHVHLLRAGKEGKRDQALLDLSFPKAELRFAPPSAAEVAFSEAAAGFVRAWGGLVQILFLASLVLAARSRRELLALTGMFLAGQTISAVLVPLTNWQPAPRFVEAAAALTIAYLAVEILLLPKAGSRWLLAGLLGGFHGLYFALFLQTTAYNPAYVLAGAAIADTILIALFAFVFSRIGRFAAALKPVQVSAALLLVIGMTWFFLRLAG